MSARVAKGAFDYVIVGGGSAGCVLANRLSTLNKKVLLLEAGPPDTSELIHTPGLIALVVGQNKKLNWCFDTTPQKHLNDRRLFWPRGKTLGGSSSINAMVYIRGHEKDYDDWNVPGWSFKEILPFFKSTERQLNMESVDAEYHGTDGELIVSNQSYTHPLSHVFLKAATQEGEVLTKDFNGEQLEGFGIFQTTIEKGRRCSSSKAFLSKEVKLRENLTIMTNAQATKLQIDEKNKQIQGVHFVDNSKVSKKSSSEEIKDASSFVEAGEVILCGGAVNSPQLLQLSGIGSTSTLSSVGLPVLHELPGVGSNLQDHLDVIFAVKEKGNTSYGLPNTFSGLVRNVKEFFQYQRSNEGPLGSNIAEAGGFVKSSPDVSYPDVQFHFLPGVAKNHGRDPFFGTGYALHCCNLRPKSSGNISLASAHPLADPLIDPNYLGDEEDLEVLLKAAKRGRKIIRSSVFDEHFGEMMDPLDQDIQSDDQIKDWIRNKSESIYHPVGSCKMGEDDGAVVDGNLKVHGIQGLRIADASIMPNIVSGNTNAPAIAIGEKCASLIMEKEA